MVKVKLADIQDVPNAVYCCEIDMCRYFDSNGSNTIVDSVSMLIATQILAAAGEVFISHELLGTDILRFALEKYSA